MDDFLIKLVKVALTILAKIFDAITLPIYSLLHRSFSRHVYTRRLRAKPTSSNDTQITYQTIYEPGKTYIRLLQKHIDTLEKMFNYATKLHDEKLCLGTRKVFQSSGNVFKKYRMGQYEWKNYIECEQEAKHFGRGLREIGVKPKDNVVIFAETRAEWMIAAQGLFKQSCTLVTIYATLGDDGITHGVNETEVETIITSHELLPKIRNILHTLPNVKNVIYFEDQLNPTNTEGFGDINVYGFKKIVKKGFKSSFEEVPPTKDDIAVIMYTSGSTGVPKGVMLSHQNCIATMVSFCDIEIFPDDIIIGFLPLAHVFELLAECVGLLNGIPIGYSSPNTLLDNSTKIMNGTKGDAPVLQPTCVAVVPLILDRIVKAINEQVNKGTPLQKAFFQKAFEYKLKWVRRGFTTPIVDALVFKKIAKMMGGKLRIVLSGGAPLSPETQEFIKVALCVDVVQGYGLTETTSGVTVTSRRDHKTGRVGIPRPMVGLRLVNWEEGNYLVTNKPYPQGEIMIGGEMVSVGYYKLPEKTAEDFFEEDNKRWFRTGDIGEIHPDGVLRIIDRKKDLVKVQTGEYISLGKVESAIKTSSLIENICVYAESSYQFCVALIVANEKALKALANTLNIYGEYEELCSNEIVEKAFIQEISAYASKCRLQRFEIPQRFTLCKDIWSPGNGLLTAAFKIRRNEIQKKYKAEIANMYKIEN